MKIQSHKFSNHTLITSIDNKRILKKSSVILDCGACIGKFTDEVLTKIPANMYLYEPNVVLYNYLMSRYFKYPRVRLVNKAISTKVGTDTLHIGNIKKSSSLLSTHRNLTPESYVVNTTTLDKEVGMLDYVDAIKLDIEGSEIDALLNTSRETLENKIGQITIEYHLHSKIDGYTEEKIDECERYLESTGFIKLTNDREDTCYYHGRYIQ